MFRRLRRQSARDEARSVFLYDVDGIPVSLEAGADSALAWDRPSPRTVSIGFVRSEGVPISRTGFEELRDAARRP